MAEYIDREEANEWVEDWLREDRSWHPYSKGKNIPTVEVFDILSLIPAADVQPVKWIPFRVRDLDEEEKADHPGWDWILDGELPEDGQRILVNVKLKGHESVQMDEYYDDDGCYLDSGYEIGTEVTHWMPLPEPPKENET